MVEDINFPKGLPPVSATNRVGKVKRKKREEDKPPFEKFLDPEEQTGKKKKKGKKEAGKADIAGKTQKRPKKDSVSASDSNGSSETQEDSEKKIIDVLV